MLLAGLVSLGLALPGAGATLPVASAALPRLELFAGRARVLAGEAWLELSPGQRLPEAGDRLVFQLSADARARLTHRGAGVDLRGALGVESHAVASWNLRIAGSGRAQVEARSIPLCVELPGAARLDVARASAWIESLPDGAWRVGCDAGVPLTMRPPAGVRWSSLPRLEPGATLRLVSARVASPSSAWPTRAAERNPWGAFQWPWCASAGPEASAPVLAAPARAPELGLASAATARALRAVFAGRVCGR